MRWLTLILRKLLSERTGEHRTCLAGGPRSAFPPEEECLAVCSLVSEIPAYTNFLHLIVTYTANEVRHTVLNCYRKVEQLKTMSRTQAKKDRIKVSSVRTTGVIISSHISTDLQKLRAQGSQDWWRC